jgi:hypothetical protein
MSVREKPTDPKPYYEAPRLLLHQPPSGRPSARLLREKNGEALRDHMKARAKALGLKNVRINNAGCLDRCDLGGDLVIYPEGVWYPCPTKGRHRRGAGEASGRGRKG